MIDNGMVLVLYIWSERCLDRTGNGKGVSFSFRDIKKEMVTTTEKEVLREKYDFIFPLGAACSCTQVLRAAGLQYRSLPFDWLYGSNVVARSQIVASGFETWLRKENMAHVGYFNLDEKRKLIYRNSLTGIIFNHDFLEGEEFDESFRKVSAKYNRRIERLLGAIRNSRTVLAVFLDSPDTAIIADDEELIAARRNLEAAFPGVKFNLLYLHNLDEVPYGERRVESPGEGILKLMYCYNAFNRRFPYQVDIPALALQLSVLRLSWRNLTRQDVWQLIKNRCRFRRKRFQFRYLSRDGACGSSGDEQKELPGGVEEEAAAKSSCSAK